MPVSFVHPDRFQFLLYRHGEPPSDLSANQLNLCRVSYRRPQVAHRLILYFVDNTRGREVWFSNARCDPPFKRHKHSETLRTFHFELDGTAAIVRNPLPSRPWGQPAWGVSGRWTFSSTLPPSQAAAMKDWGSISRSVQIETMSSWLIA